VAERALRGTTAVIVMVGFREDVAAHGESVSRGAREVFGLKVCQGW
jgi:hypothetical protein